MASTPRDRIDTLRDRIETGEEIAGADRELLLEFSDRLDLLAQTYSDYRHEKLLRHCTIMAEELDGGALATALEDRQTAEGIVGWINRNYDNEETNRDYRSAFRVFAKRVAGEDGECPPSVDWVPTGTSSDYDPTPDPRDMLHWEEHVKPMADEAYNNRDAAMIALQFDAGLRGGEFKDLTVGDIQDHDHGLRLTTDGGKTTPRRSFLLIPSVPYVNEWLNDHPAREDPDAPMWSKLHQPEPISDRMVLKTFDEAAKRAGVTKPITPTNFRKSSAAFLASRNLNQAHIEDHHGWVRGSKAAARYISVFGEDSDREIARLHGVDVSDEEPESIAPIPCWRCEYKNSRGARFCAQCGQVLDREAAVELDETSDELQESLASLPPEKAEELLAVADILDDPSVRGALLDDAE